MSKDREVRYHEKSLPQEKWVLRLAETGDLSALLAVEEVSFPHPWTERSFRNEFKNPYSRIWVLEEERRVIGYICAWFIDDKGQIANVAVLPEYRRMGAGKLLIQHVLQEARMQGVRSFSLEVRRNNSAAFNLYKLFGFEKVAVRESYYENGEDALLMICSLLPL